MTKHVFEITKYGRIYHCGEFVSESEHFVTAKKPGDKPRRQSRHGLALIETDQPDLLVEAWAREWSSWKQEITAAEAALKFAERKRLNASRAAIGLDAV